MYFIFPFLTLQTSSLFWVVFLLLLFYFVWFETGSEANQVSINSMCLRLDLNSWWVLHFPSAGIIAITTSDPRTEFFFIEIQLFITTSISSSAQSSVWQERGWGGGGGGMHIMHAQEDLKKMLVSCSVTLFILLRNTLSLNLYLELDCKSARPPQHWRHH